MGDGVRGVPAEDAVHHDEEVFGHVGLDGVAPDINPVGRRLLGAHLRRFLAAHGHHRLDGPLPAAAAGGVGAGAAEGGARAAGAQCRVGRGWGRAGRGRAGRPVRGERGAGAQGGESGED
jgi:hypothetical protein